MDPIIVKSLIQNTTEEVDPTIISNYLEEDARLTFGLSVLLIICGALAYQIKEKKLYSIPESAVTIWVGAIAGLIVRLFGKDLSPYLSVLPDVAFYALIPLIVFEAGYCFECAIFFQNLLPIVLYASLGTLISTFIVGYSVFFAAEWGLISHGIDTNSPMEALMFGALISATDPVATLSIMGNPDLHVDETLYTLVFGEAVLNDAVAIVLFDTFRISYHKSVSEFHFTDLCRILYGFVTVTVLSVLVGLLMGLIQSYIYKHSSISNYKKMEMALLLLFCYCNYSVAQVLSLSGIMALFINGIVVSHYNSFNLSKESKTTSEHIFSTLAYLAEQILFLCMGLYACCGILTHYWNLAFSFSVLLLCLTSRAIGISSLSWITNYFRSQLQLISWPMQIVMWWAGLRGACAFGLALNMPGPNKESYAAVTLSICILTTFVGGGLTNAVLDKMEMKKPLLEPHGDEALQEESIPHERIALIERGSKLRHSSLNHGILRRLLRKHSTVRRLDDAVRDTAAYAWRNLDEIYLRPYFGGDFDSVNARDMEYDPIRELS
jgi:sodium/hydrogen exchanger 8